MKTLESGATPHMREPMAKRIRHPRKVYLGASLKYAPLHPKCQHIAKTSAGLTKEAGTSS
jgi:hypothetical protein